MKEKKRWLKGQICDNEEEKGDDYNEEKDEEEEKDGHNEEKDSWSCMIDDIHVGGGREEEVEKNEM